MPEVAKKPKVIVADDEHVIADTLATILNKSGYEAHAVYSGDEALAMAPVLQPDMLVTDIHMPGVNGIDTAIRLRELLPGIKILLFSGHATYAGCMDKVREKGYEFDFLAKPVHPRDLISKLQG